MNGSRISLLASALLAAVTAPAVLAHHSITGEFDQSQTFELRGTLTAFDWANPHLWYYVDVTKEDGSVEHWQCTTGTNPNRLLRAGWKRTDLPIGSKVVFARANPARDGSHTCYTGGIALEDGTQIFGGRRGE
ncbi:MAG: hypothetical protein LBE21_11290 [Pseudomonadales bacterium]|jgi:hypothetical protein|nr:hypothetical protein [Pseudomonadales bacterium]